jgi:hypothetical protein
VYERDPVSEPNVDRTLCTIRLEILRLDLLLTLDACRSVRWRSLLDVPQRFLLTAVLADVHEGLQASTDEVLPRSLASVQNRLLDAVLQHIGGLNEAGAPPAQRVAS